MSFPSVLTESLLSSMGFQDLLWSLPSCPILLFPSAAFYGLLHPSMAFYILPWSVSWYFLGFCAFLQWVPLCLLHWAFPGWSLSIPVLLFPCVWSAVQLTRTLQERARNAQNIAEPISMHDAMLSPKESPPFLGSLVKSMLICAAFSLDLSLTSNSQTAPPQSP